MKFLFVKAILWAAMVGSFLLAGFGLVILLWLPPASSTHAISTNRVVVGSIGTLCFLFLGIGSLALLKAAYKKTRE